MRTLKQLTSAAVLIIVLAMSAFAGDIQIPGPPPPPAASSATTAPGDIHIPGAMGTPVTPSDSVIEVALNLLQTVLSIF